MSEISCRGFEPGCLLTYYQNTQNFLPHLRGREIALVNACIKGNKKAAAPKRQINLRKKLGDEDNILFPDESCNICFPFIFIYWELDSFINIKTKLQINEEKKINNLGHCRLFTTICLNQVVNQKLLCWLLTDFRFWTCASA